MILNCYRLAEKFHTDPDIFLRKPISQIGRALYWTDRMNAEEDQEAAWHEHLRNSY